MSEETARGKVSRRSMLKRLGAGAAVAWSAPVLTSIRTPAFAQYPTQCEGCPDCDFSGVLCGGDLLCSCGGSGATCLCASSAACQVGEPICSTDADCTNEFCEGPGVCTPCQSPVFPSCAPSVCWCRCGSPFPAVADDRIRVLQPSS